MRNEYSANLGMLTFEEERKKGKPSREYRKARENKRNHGQSGILAHNLALILQRVFPLLCILGCLVWCFFVLCIIAAPGSIAVYRAIFRG